MHRNERDKNHFSFSTHFCYPKIYFVSALINIEKENSLLYFPISSIEIGFFFILIAVWAGFLFGGFFYGKLNEDESRRMPIATRLLSSFTLVIAGWAWFAIARGTNVANFATFVAIGMTFGFIGDVFMAKVFAIEPHIIYGMLAFGIGHVIYIIGMGMIALPEHNANFHPMLIIFIWWFIALVLWYLVVFRGSERNTIIYLALPYAILLATTVGVAMTLTLQDASFILVMIGAILFLISDLVLAAQLFNNLHFKYIGDVVWFLYGPGQMLIVFGIILFTVINNLTILP